MVSKMGAAVSLAILITAPSHAEEDRSWHLMTKSYAGTVSLIKGLTKEECEHMKCHVVRPACDVNIPNGSTWMIQPGDISWNDAECFQ